MIAYFVGVVVGVLAGLLPGVHTNTVAAFVAHAGFVAPDFAGVIIVCAALAQTVIEVIPAVLIGVPDPHLALLPQHKMVLRGRAYEVVRMAVLGSLVGGLAAVVASPVLFALKGVYGVVQPVAPWCVLAVLVYTIVSAKDRARHAVMALVAGLLGGFVLGRVADEPLLVLFSGLFGLPSIIGALQRGQALPVQVVPRWFELPSWWGVLVMIAGACSLVCMVLPALGAAQAALMAGVLLRRWDDDAFVFVLGMLGAMNQVFAVGWWMVAGSLRTGTVAALDVLGVQFSWYALVIVVVVCMPLAACGGLALARVVVRRHEVVGSRPVLVGCAVFVVGLVAVLSGVSALAAMVACASVGVIAGVLRVRKSVLMACIVVPYVLNAV